MRTVRTSVARVCCCLQRRDALLATLFGLLRVQAVADFVGLLMALVTGVLGHPAEVPLPPRGYQPPLEEGELPRGNHPHRHRHRHRHVSSRRPRARSTRSRSPASSTTRLHRVIRYTSPVPTPTLNGHAPSTYERRPPGLRITLHDLQGMQTAEANHFLQSLSEMAPAQAEASPRGSLPPLTAGPEDMDTVDSVD